MSLGACYIYENFRKNLATKKENLASDSYSVALFSSSYTPQVNSDCAYQVNAPAAPSLSQTASGSQGARTEYFKITHVNPAGETTPSTEANIAVSANNVPIVTSPTNPGGSSTGYNVYGATVSGAEKLQNVSPIAYGTNWQEPATGLTNTGASPPGTNTAQISGEVAAGNGYSTGGIALTSTGLSVWSGSTFPDVWTGSTAYQLGQMVRPATPNGFIYVCAQAGVTGSSAPTWGTSIFGLTTDGSVQWCAISQGFEAFVAANVSLAVTGVVTYRYPVVYSATTEDLVCYFDPGGNQSSANSGNLNLNWDPAGLFVL
jgi:hypothetical protein